MRQQDYTVISDPDLLQLIREGQVHAFNEVYARYFKLLYKYAYNILRNEAECNDAIQEIFVWIWENRETLEVSSLKGYLLAAVRYKLARTIQTSKRRAEILSNTTTHTTFTQLDDDLAVKELRQVISDFTDSLPPRSREIFRLSRLNHLTNKEIASQLGISEKTVENQLTIALKKLRTDLGKRMLTIFFL
ncbi:RNA polymerase sigma-70 factor [Chitinophaga sp. Cy-1792]|uniref:RNA polymerase sigma-70 factor n=1 Tax=Chitinophaga sp. Cy-1792 TaxID=2608339 RepID=UPI00141DB91E|nr:RNA polymerase sigma-70 factor [Chitinophaga sp. Cy-1792]NIG57280.1 RNA polymerase sigma-70 factor [Chitinophaga sp. Cy-1792]